MSLQADLDHELRAIRKSRNGVTVGSLAGTEILLRVLGGGDPRAAYNSLKQILLADRDGLANIAVAYSLGFESAGQTHLARLTDFGRDYNYNQRQARRYSDQGLLELSRRILTEWTIHSSPTCTVTIPAGRPREDVLFTTQHTTLLQMNTPIIETVNADGLRSLLAISWHHQVDSEVETSSTLLPQFAFNGHALSLRWQGELWPRFILNTYAPVQATVFGNRIQLSRLI